MSKRAAFVLVHGAWHSAACWGPIIEGLHAAGYKASAIDLPGSGADALMPVGYSPRTSVFSSSPALNTRHTQQQRTEAVLREAAAVSADGPVIIVGHSLGSLTATAAMAAAPEQVAAVVYVGGEVMAAPLSCFHTSVHPTRAGASARCLVGDVMALGAARIDWLSPDAAYRAMLRTAFAADVDEAAFAQHALTCYPDEGLQPFGQPSPATAERCGHVPRYHVRLGEDQVMPPAAQDWMREEMDKAMGSPSREYRLASSHLVMLSRPTELVQLLLEIAEEVQNRAPQPVLWPADEFDRRG